MNSLDIRFGEFIREHRKALKMTQQEAANSLDMPRTTYQHYENGETQATLDIMLRMEKVFGFKMQEFFDRVKK